MGKHKKEKKEKKEKSSKSSRKDSKNKHKHKHKRKYKHDRKDSISHDGESANQDMGHHLSCGLLEFPTLFSELPSIIASLDVGEVVNINNISHLGKRRFLHELMDHHLPVLQMPEVEGGGWYKDQSIVSVSGYILMALLHAGNIVQPATLTNAQTLASRTAPLHLLGLLEKCPSPALRQQLHHDLCGLFQTLLLGNAVQLDGLEDEDVAAGLSKLFLSAGLQESVDGFAINESSPESSTAVEVLLAMLQTHPASTFGDDGLGARVETTNERAGQSSPSPSSSSSSDDDSIDMDASMDAAVPAMVPKRAIGPSMPPPAPTDPASNPDMHSSAIDDAGDDSEEEVGPRPTVEIDLGPMEARVKRAEYAAAGISAVPIGLDADAGHMSMDEFLGGRHVGQEEITGPTIERTQSTGVGSREEWMLTPGEERASLTEAFGEARKFQGGKGAKKAAAALKQRIPSSLGATGTGLSSSEEEQRALAVLDEYRALRGPSLLEQHAAKTAAANPKKSGRHAFDWEKDVATHRVKVGSHEARKLVDDAKKLDSRFDRAVQR